MSSVSTLAQPLAASKEIPQIACSRTLTVGSLVAADMLAVLFSGVVAIALRLVFHGDFHMEGYAPFLGALPLFFLVYSAMDLYPGIAANAIEEFRGLMRAITLSYLLVLGSTFFIKAHDHYSRIAFVIGWLLTLALAPMTRHMLRNIGAKQSWWGVPTVIFGTDKTAQNILRVLQEQPTLGLRPIAVLHQDGSCPRLPNPGSLYTGDFSQAEKLAAHNKGSYAVLALPALRSSELEEVLNEYSQHFHHTLVMPDVTGMSSLWVSARDFGGMLGLEVEQKLSHTLPRVMKRCFDLLVAGAISLCLLPLFVVLYLCTRLSSPGPVFYGHRRLGRGHQMFTAWKFRSMVTNGDEVLQEHLDRDPALRAEWERDRKLKRDPRVTTIGSIMRKTSLDELPQLWNVLCGDMSLVGPRPIVMAEVERYGNRYQHYRRVTPGITGLWQVSGRNSTTYQRRTEIDEYYVRNWSISLDLYILYRTVKTVLFTEGAY